MKPSVPAVPTRWQNASANAGAANAGELESWWLQLHDPTLDQLIGLALKNSPDVRTALARIDEARARFRLERTNLIPTVTGSVSDKRTRVTDRTTHVTSYSDSAGASLDASWEIDLFGRERLTTAAAKADFAQSEENVRDVQVSLAAEVASTYVLLRASEGKLTVVQSTLKSLEETYQLTRWKEQAGSGSSLDVQQSLSNLEQTRASVPSLQQSVTEARNKLALLCGKPPGALDSALNSASGVPAAPATFAVGIPADTLRQRPDVRAAERAVEAAALRTLAAKADRYPSLTLSGSIGVEALHANKLFSPEATVASVVGGLTAPIFDAGRINRTIDVQDALERQALIAYESTVLTALSEVENALSSIQRNNERLASLNKAADAASESATLARQRYDAGDVDFFAVLDAQRTLLALNESQVGTTADLTTAYIQLYKALGGGWAKL